LVQHTTKLKRLDQKTPKVSLQLTFSQTNLLVYMDQSICNASLYTKHGKVSVRL